MPVYWLDHMSCISIILRLRPVIYAMLGLSIVGVVVSSVIKGHFGGMSEEAYNTFTIWAFILILLVSIVQVIIINIQ